MKVHLASAKAAVKAEIEGVREGLLAARALSLSAPQQHARGRRFIHGLVLPWVALGRVLKDGALRGVYLRTTLPGCLIVLMLMVGTLVRGYLSPSAGGGSESGPTLTFDQNWNPSLETVAPNPPLVLLAPAMSVREPPVSRLHRIKVAYLLWLSGFYAALVLVESVLIALTGAARDRLSLALSPLVEAPPPLPTDPRVRRGLRALARRLLRRGMGVAVLCVGGAAPHALRVIPWAGKWLSAPLESAWVFYWICVFAIGNAEPAWHESSGREPFFMRWLSAAGRVPLLGWLIGPYIWVMRALSRQVRAPSLHAEESSYAAVGLGISASICAIPVVRGFLQPVLPAAAELVLARGKPRADIAPQVDLG